MRQRFFLFSLIVFVLSIFLIGIGVGKILSSRNSQPVATPVATLVPSPIIASEATTSAERVLVTRVVDGDTIELSTGQRVRYIGIDTPETVNPNTPVECFGKSASEKNKELVLGKEVRLEKDISETDRYGRLLRYVYSNVEGQETMINEFLVAEGFANSSSYPPDIKYQTRFQAAETAARTAEKGLWKSCASISPSTQTEQTTETSVLAAETNTDTASNTTCTIKGNISASGDKIFHVKGCGSYEKTAIDENRGERWFCSEAEAASAGWRKAKNC